MLDTWDFCYFRSNLSLLSGIKHKKACNVAQSYKHEETTLSRIS